MKKILFLVVLILGIVNLRGHPLLKPYIDEILNLASIQAKNTAGIIESPIVFDHLKDLESAISPYEYNYIISNIKDLEQATNFYRAQCHDIELAHTILTQYTIKKICGILSKDLN